MASATASPSSLPPILSISASPQQGFEGTLPRFRLDPVSKNGDEGTGFEEPLDFTGGNLSGTYYQHGGILNICKEGVEIHMLPL